MMGFQQSWWEFLIGVLVVSVGWGGAAFVWLAAALSVPVALDILPLKESAVAAAVVAWVVTLAVAAHGLLDGRW